jgi:8-oxo-dGTP diphosphatase
LREVKEETGLILTNYQLRAVITFKSNEWETEYMYLFTANEFSGELISCNEGDLEWVNKNQILDLNIWEGDRIFLEKIIKDNQFFTLKVVYEGNKLVESILKEY